MNTSEKLQATAEQVARHIAEGVFSAGVVEKMASDAGCLIDGFVVWFRPADRTVVAWAGNDHDPDMNWPAEVRVPGDV